jgi:hypothetical protein
MSDEVILTRRQAEICRSYLEEELEFISMLIAKGQDEDGNPLDYEHRLYKVRDSMDLQITLLALGMSSEEIAKIVSEAVDEDSDTPH